MLQLDSSYLAAVFIKKVLGYATVANFVGVLDKVRAALIIDLLVVMATDENGQVMHVGKLIWRYQRIGGTRLASTRCTTRSMDKQL